MKNLKSILLKMEQKQSKKILLHACCGICSAYPILKLKELGYLPVVYFSNSNLDTEEEFEKRLDAQKTVCKYHNVELLIDEYVHDEFLKNVTGLENEPEGGKRCTKCIEYRLKRAVKKLKELNFDTFATSLGISPHKNYEMITELGLELAKENKKEYFVYNFRKQDGVLKTNKLSADLELYRQNYCGCEFSKRNEQ